MAVVQPRTLIGRVHTNPRRAPTPYHDCSPLRSRASGVDRGRLRRAMRARASRPHKTRRAGGSRPSPALRCETGVRPCAAGRPHPPLTHPMRRRASGRRVVRHRAVIPGLARVREARPPAGEAGGESTAHSRGDAGSPPRDDLPAPGAEAVPADLARSSTSAVPSWAGIAAVRAPLACVGQRERRCSFCGITRGRTPASARAPGRAARRQGASLGESDSHPSTARAGDARRRFPKGGEVIPSHGRSADVTRRR